KQIENITQLHLAEKARIQASIDYRSDNLALILSICFFICVLIGGAFASYTVIRVLKEISMLKNKILEISEGKLIAPIPPSRDELNSIIKALNTLIENLRNIQLFAHEVGSGNFDSNISVFNGQHELGESLADMRHSLKTVAQEEKNRHWVNIGLAQFSELLRTSTDDQTTYYQNLISALVGYLQVNQAALYVAESEADETVKLVLKASYAYGRLKYHEKVLEPGQGLTGQVFLEKQAQYLKHLPANYLQISSGLGEAPPTHLALIPLKVNDEVNGVLELASFRPLAAHEIEFLNKITENISGALHNITNVQTTTRLLEEAQGMAQAVQAQEEMLRQNSEELIATQEQLNRDLQETNQKLAFMEKAQQQGALPQLILTDAGKVIMANTQATAFFHRQLQGIHVHELIPQDELVNSISNMHSDSPLWLNFTHSEGGKASLCLQSFSMEGKTFINLQILPEALVALT
ncbi:MAG: GAF domain-containing protein, partial [Bacteroidetes bacterium]|nr:GAF domain-containing protein [Bacteroidota bacterium]